MYLLNKLSVAFEYYTDYSFFIKNNHIYIDNFLLYSQLNEIFNNIHLLYNKSDISNYQIIIKEDMNIKVFVLSYCVIRICCIDIYNKKCQSDPFPMPESQCAYADNNICAGIQKANNCPVPAKKSSSGGKGNATHQ